MSKHSQADGPSPQQWEISRRRMLRNLGAAAAAVPFAGFLTEALTDMPANASPRERSLAGKRVAANAVFDAPFASHPGYKFTFVNHVTTNTFFTATIYGLEDAAAALGIPKPQWTGSTELASSPRWSTAINTAIAAGVNGIAVALIDPVAFNTPINNALGEGHTGRVLQRRRVRQQPDGLHRPEQPHRRCSGRQPDRRFRSGQQG